MTKNELSRISERVDEINDILDLCGPNDCDVVDSLQLELDEYIEVLEHSYKIARRKEYKIRIVK